MYIGSYEFINSLKESEKLSGFQAEADSVRDRAAAFDAVVCMLMVTTQVKAYVKPATERQRQVRLRKSPASLVFSASGSFICYQCIGA